MIHGVAIPGLGMAAHELPEVKGLVRLENPEIGQGPTIGATSYSLYDVAELHAQKIEALANASAASPFWVLGMSMGGMVAAILASDLRSRLPRSCRFLFLVTSANTKVVPAVDDQRLEEWMRARPGSVESFRSVMAPFFSKEFTARSPEVIEAYASYRASGANGQSPKAFMRQVSALRGFDGALYFSRIKQDEAAVISGAEDYVLDPRHAAELRRLLPHAEHTGLTGVGHMINLERPAIFQPWSRGL